MPAAITIMASLSPAARPNLFSSPPPPPPFNDPIISPVSPPPLPHRNHHYKPYNRSNKRKDDNLNDDEFTSPTTKRSSKNEFTSPTTKRSSKNAAFNLPHTRTNYQKPVSPSGAILAADPADAAAGRAVVVGPSGVSFRVPGAPFDFQYSYSEIPKAAPLAIREPAFLPFSPPSMPRPWTGKAPLLSKKEKLRKKGIKLFRPLGEKEMEEEEGIGEEGLMTETKGKRKLDLGVRVGDGRSRQEVLGEPLTKQEVREMVKPHLSHNRQVNLGRDGLTHNMLEMIHCHWRRQEICKVRCRGVPTIDMNNICRCLEEKSGGKIIYRVGGILYLFRGRNYNPRTRPRYPVMLWRPATPVYPKLIQEAPEGLTKEEADKMRQKGQNLLPICKLSKNGIYINLVKDVRNAFEGSELAKINCEGMHASDYKKLGAKLKELVPCVLLSFDDEKILMYRGKEWKSMYPNTFASVPSLERNDEGSDVILSGQSTGENDKNIEHRRISSPKMLSLWNHAVDSMKALLLEDDKVSELSPDSLLTKVEEFETASQAAEHSYPALLLASGEEPDFINAEFKDVEPETDESGTDDGQFEDFDSLDNLESSAPLGSLPIDSLTEKLSRE